MSNYEYWVRDGVNHIIPSSENKYPESSDIKELVKSLADEVGYQSVIDFGCGQGRLCTSFDPEKYLGLDINKEMLLSAQKEYVGYRFEEATPQVRSADIYFAYTVFSYLTDNELHAALRNMRCKYLIVGEILGREWRNEKIPFSYSRELSDYVQMLRCHDLILQKHIQKPHEEYIKAPWYEGKNTNLSFLVFRKCRRNPSIY